MVLIRLNLGCGSDIREGWLNYDKYIIKPGVYWIDLNSPPFLDFPDCYADEILLNHVFEHLSCNRYEFMKEMSRILKPGGKLMINVPVNHQCMEHENIFFTNSFFNNLTTENYGCLFKKVDCSFTKNNFRNMFCKVKQFVFWVVKHKIKYELTK